MNYLEELAYWYFRLNGYFVIRDFVNHKDQDLLYTHDTDIIGVRFPYVFETVGGHQDDYQDDIASAEKICCIICEVKSGRYEPDRIFNNIEILKKCIRRIGIFDEQKSNEITEYLFRSKEWCDDKVIIYKALV